MIRAAASAASGGAPPPELALAWQCRAWGALPNAGGILDQPAGLLERMRQAEAVYAAMRAWLASDRSAAWRNEHKDVWNIVKRIEALRVQAIS